MGIADELEALRKSGLVSDTTDRLLHSSSSSTTFFTTPEIESERLRRAMLACKSRTEINQRHGYIDTTRQIKHSNNTEAYREALRKHGYSDVEALRLCELYRKQEEERRLREEEAERERVDRERIEMERLLHEEQKRLAAIEAEKEKVRLAKEAAKTQTTLVG